MRSVDRSTRLASHLRYEITTMASSAQWTLALKHLAPNGDLSERQLAELHNACFESFLVHVRLLIEFLVGRRHVNENGREVRRRSSRDVRPGDFAGARWTVDSADPNVRRLDAALPDIDSHLAHLSKARGRDADAAKWWAPGELAESVLDLMREYVGTRDPGAVRDLLEQALRESSPV